MQNRARCQRRTQKRKDLEDSLRALRLASSTAYIAVLTQAEMVRDEVMRQYRQEQELPRRSGGLPESPGYRSALPSASSLDPPASEASNSHAPALLPTTLRGGWYGLVKHQGQGQVLDYPAWLELHVRKDRIWGDLTVCYRERATGPGAVIRGNVTGVWTSTPLPSITLTFCNAHCPTRHRAAMTAALDTFGTVLQGTFQTPQGLISGLPVTGEFWLIKVRSPRRRPARGLRLPPSICPHFD